jgi:hypothetical protein
MRLQNVISVGDPGSEAFLTPGFGWKNSGPGMEKNSGSGIWDGKNLDPGYSGSDFREHSSQDNNFGFKKFKFFVN